ncbi:MAG: ATP-binding cassette domain-containing protein, partial [Rhodospirillaceae bacterium]
MPELLKRLTASPVIMVQVILATVLVNLLSLGSSIYSIQVLNRYVAHGVTATLAALTAGVLIAVLFEFLFRLIRQRLAMALTEGPDQKLASLAFDLLGSTKVQALERLAPGTKRDLIQAPELARQAYGASTLTAFLDAPFSLLFVAVLFLLSPLLGFIALGVVCLGILIGVIQQLAMRVQGERGRDAAAARDQALQAGLRHADTIRAFSALSLLSNQWRSRAALAASARRVVEAWQGRGQAALQMLSGLMVVGITAAAAVQVVEGALSVGAMIGANILAARALGPISRIVSLTEPMIRAKRAVRQLQTLTGLPRERSEGAVIAPYSGAIAFQDLGFMHPGGSAPLFESLTLAPAPGDVIVVMGANGTGKTTLARMVAGLLDPSRGSILVDGVDLRQVDPAWWRQQIMYLPQEPTFLDASMGDNIAAANPELTPELMGKLVKATDLSEHLARLKDGIATPITEGGATLPVGIRRRLALARAVGVGGPVAILDEPTEGLDAQGAAAVYALMNRMHEERRTILVFTHDPNIVKGAQWLIDLNHKPRPRLARAVAGPPPGAEANAQPGAQTG